MGRTIYMELVGTSPIATDLSAGGLMVKDKTLALHEVCEIVVFNDGGQLELPAKAVYVDGNGGVGLELVGFDASVRAKLAELIEAGDAAAAAGSDVGTEPGDIGTDPSNLDGSDNGMALGSARATDLGTGSDPAIDASEEGGEGDGAGGDDGEGDDGAGESTEGSLAGAAEPAEAKSGDALAGEDIAAEDEDESEEHKSLHVRLRGLPLIEQMKRAKAGDITERMLLERMYGKNVWEALLRNPRLTAPEAARIARMGALPRPMIELIVGNGAWLQVPEVRRALLSNPRLGTDHIIKLLRLMSKQELKLATIQTAYPMPVRMQAKALLKAEGG